jgi:glycerate kinase
MRALIAFDKFKDALSAADACATAAAALREAQPSWELELCPLTDGGEGFAEILTAAGHGRIESVNVTGPRGSAISAQFGWVPLQHIPERARQRLALPARTDLGGLAAIIGMSAASGLHLLSPAERDPWRTSTVGTGELMRFAAHKAQVIVLGIGGSATNDLGAGALSALGLQFKSATSETSNFPSPDRWDTVTHLAGRMPADFPPVRVACDVTNPLLGPEGCAAIYGLQKGLKPEDLPRLERSAARLARLLCEHFHQPESLMSTPGAGAAGGIAFGLLAAMDAQLLSGFDLTAEWLGLKERIHAADVVLTGEGRFDESSLSGKGPGAIVALAQGAGRPAHVFAGSVSSRLTSFAKLHRITPESYSLTEALNATRALLQSEIRRQFAAT